MHIFQPARHPRVSALAFAGVLAAVPALSFAQGGFEAPPVFRAADVVPKALLSGPNHRVEDRVENDGLMNHYTISSRFGTVTATSNAELRERVHEMNVVALLEELKGTNEFAKHIGEAAGDVVEGARNLVTKPGETVSGAVSGVGKLFQRAGDSVFGDPPADSEDSGVKRLIGFSSTKREYAKKFDVDPYSANPVLQESLEAVAWAGFAGDISASAALMAVPGGAGAAVSIAKGTDNLEEVDVSLAPTDLRRMNRDKLQAMGVSEELTDLFLGNTVYSPTDQARLVNALAAIRGAKGIDAFVKVAVRTDSHDVALFRQRQAAMYAGYHRVVKPLAMFEPVANVSSGRTADGTMVVVAPVDYAIWSESLARTFASVQDGRGEKRELWLAGGISDRARAEIEKHGWKVFDHAETKLLAGS